MVVAEAVEDAVEEEVAELGGDRVFLVQRLTLRPVDGDHHLAGVLAGERQHIGRLVFAAELAIEAAHRGVVDERDRHLADVFTGGQEHFSREGGDLALGQTRGGSGNVDAGQVGLRSLSARSYATTIFCTSGCRTTSLSLNSKNLMPSTL